MLSTMVYDDEVNSPEEIRELADLDGVDVSDKELAMAEALIESLSAEFKPEQFMDTHRNQVLELIERKAAGETERVAAPVAASSDKVVDLMAALEASVAAAKESRKNHPTSRPADEPAEGDAADHKKPKATKAATAKKAAKKAPASRRKTA